MFGSQILEAAIGLVLIYLVLSLLCSAFREMFEGYMRTRAAFLERGIRELLHDGNGTGLASAVYNHPLLYGLFQGGYDPAQIKKNGLMPPGSKLPTYIPSRNFALALLDIAARGTEVTEAEAAHPSAPRISPEMVRARVATLQNPPVQRAVLSAIDTAGNDLEKARTNLEAWYDSAMDRVSGWYKRRTQAILLGLGVGIAIAVNANTITIAKRLYQNSATREALVTRATALTRDSVLPDGKPQELLAELGRFDLPLGWTTTTFGFPGTKRTVVEERNGRQTETEVTLRWWDSFLSPLIGWVLTGLAVTLGAPFWFDLLNKFTVIRTTVKPHEKSPEEASEDRQRPPTQAANQGQARVQVPAQLPPAVSTPPPPPVAPTTGAGGFTPQRWATGDADEGDL